MRDLEIGDRIRYLEDDLRWPDENGVERIRVARRIHSSVVTGGFDIQWSVPAGISTQPLIRYYLFFFLVVYFTANSFGEELVFRSYPVEQFRDSSAAMIGVAALGAFYLIHHYRTRSSRGFCQIGYNEQRAVSFPR